ncbi:unnamed protein product [Brassica rapa]|uniref:Uncharacterized protein n=2 Tax=Brassica TaxID=3705 RepID=A0A3P5ZBD2_BRACM|nr:unnamed protein product [Brassica napus]CAG7873713.1 unnamed protein product [Brassica rapa]VDC69508.1 unnamed protein product [Brassica rapa]
MSGLLQFNFFPTDFYYPKPNRVETADKVHKPCVQSVSSYGFKKEMAIVVGENNQSGLVRYVNGETKRRGSSDAATTFLEYCDSTS